MGINFLQGLDPDVQAAKNWLQNQVNRSITIRKKEDGDSDVVRMQVDEVGYRPAADSIDGYTGGAALVIHGSGTIWSGQAEAPLPGGSYVISAAGLSVSGSSDAGLLLRTERAEYSLSPVPAVPNRR